MICSLCLKESVFVDSHHILPQAKGGKDYQQINLCPSCHTGLHRCLNAPDKVEEFIFGVQNKKLVKVLLSALKLTKDLPSINTKVTISLPSELHKKLKNLSKDYAITLENLIISIVNKHVS